MKREQGRPADLSARIATEQRCYELLERLHIPFDRVDHAHADTMDICAAIGEVLGAPICKNLLLCNRQCTAFYLLMMPGDKAFKTKDLSAQIGSSRLSFAQGEYMEEFLQITPGSLSILGLMNDKEKRVRLLIDEDILREEYIGCHPCINTSSLRLKTRDVCDILIPALQHDVTVVRLPRYE